MAYLPISALPFLIGSNSAGTLYARLKATGNVPAGIAATAAVLAATIANPAPEVSFQISGTAAAPKFTVNATDSDGIQSIYVRVYDNQGQLTQTFGPSASGDTSYVVTWVPAPAGSYTAKAAVTDKKGIEKITDVQSFTVVQTALTPTITSFTPVTGLSGTVVTVTGTNLSSITAASFAGTAVANDAITNNTATSVTLLVPTAAASGKISLTTAGGTATSSADFTVTVAGPGLQLGANDVAVIPMGGQSNELSNANQEAYGYPPMNTIGGDVAQVFANVFMYRAGNNTLQPLQEGINTRPAEDNSIPVPYTFHTSDAGVWRVGDGGAAYNFQVVTRCYFLAKQFKAQYPNGTLVIVQGAVGGVARSRWVKANNDLYTRFVNQVNQAKALITAQGKTPRILAIDFTQGEQDSAQGTTLAVYDAQMRQMWSDLLADIGTAETQCIEFGIPDDGSSGTYKANPFNALKAAWAAEQPARRRYFAPDFVTLEEDRIHWNAASQMYAGALTFSAAFQSAISFPTPLSQVGPTISYNATTQLVTITPPTDSWVRVEFFYQISSYAPVQLINSWTVSLPVTAQIGDFKCWSRAVAGRAKSAITSNAEVWNVAGRQKLPAGFAQWAPERGNFVSAGVYGVTLSGRTIAHNPAAPNGWTNRVPAMQRIMPIPPNVTGEVFRAKIPAISRAKSAVTIGFATTPDVPDNQYVSGLYIDSAEFHLQLGGGVNAGGGNGYPDAGLDLFLVLTISEAGSGADLSLQDATGHVYGNVVGRAVLTPCYIIAYLYGAADWQPGQLASQVSDVYFQSDWLEQAFEKQ